MVPRTIPRRRPRPLKQTDELHHVRHEFSFRWRGQQIDHFLFRESVFAFRNSRAVFGSDYWYFSEPLHGNYVIGVRV